MRLLTSVQGHCFQDTGYKSPGTWGSKEQTAPYLLVKQVNKPDFVSLNNTFYLL